MGKNVSKAALAGIELLLADGTIVSAASAGTLHAESPAALSPQPFEADAGSSSPPVAAGGDARVLNVAGPVDGISSEQIDAFISLSASLQAKLDASPLHSGAGQSRPDATMCLW